MRILWITPGFAADAQDHNCIPPLQLLAAAMLRCGVDLYIIALDYPFSDQVYYWPVKERGAVVFPCKGQNRRWLRWRSFRRARAFTELAHAAQKFDAIHSFWLGPAWVLGNQFAAQWDIPHWTTLMGQDVLPANRYLRRLKPNDAAHLIALTPFHNDQLEKTCAIRAAYCIPWGVAEQDIPEHLPNARPIDVLGVGSLLPVKDWVRWLRVLRLVVDERPSLYAELIGHGPEMARLQQLARRLGLEGNLRFAGSLPRARVLARMQESRVLLHTARFESFGFVFAEAAASGCRIVGTPVGAAPELGVCAEADTALAEIVLQTIKMPLVEIPQPPLRIRDSAEACLNLYRT